MSTEAPKDIVKKTFDTREGVYRISEYIEGQPRGGGATTSQTSGFGANRQNNADSSNGTTPVRISCTKIENGETLEHICFNHGRELHFMPFMLNSKTTPQQKEQNSDSETTKMYKGTVPTCHDVLVPNTQNAHQLAQSIRTKTEQQQLQQQNGQNAIPPSASLQSNAADFTSLNHRFFVLVGFGAGQIQLFEASRPQQYVFFNEARAVDMAKVLSIKWVPNLPGQQTGSKFLAAHASGHIYLYDTSLPCDHIKPNFIQLKTPQFGNNSVLSLHANKNKAENPTHRLSLRTGSVNQLAFSPCGQFLALACQDGFLRVIRFGNSSSLDLSSIELCVQVRSFFGGFTCVAWSPDGRYLALGGEDDLVTMVSFHENRVVCRGRGHRSWITAIAFDPYACVCGPLPTTHQKQPPSSSSNATSSGSRVANKPSSNAAAAIMYRLASVGQDTVLCVWELTEDLLVSSQLQLVQKQRLRSRSSLLVNGPLLSLMTPGSLARNGSDVSSQTPATASTQFNPLKSANGIVDQPNVQLTASNSNSGGFSSGFSPAQSGRGTPSPSSTVGSASGSSIAGQLASKFAFWHREKKNGSSSSKLSKKKTKDKRGSLTSNASTPANQHDGTAANGGVTNGDTITIESSQYQIGTSIRSSHSDLSTALSNGGQQSTIGVSSLSNGAIATVAAHSATQGSLSMAVSTPTSGSPHLSWTGQQMLGTSSCPRLNDVPCIEPLVAKKVALDPLSGVAFLKDCLLTACQAGYLAVWARPVGHSNGGDVQQAALNGSDVAGRPSSPSTTTNAVISSINNNENARYNNQSQPQHQYRQSNDLNNNGHHQPHRPPATTTTPHLNHDVTASSFL